MGLRATAHGDGIVEPKLDGGRELFSASEDHVHWARQALDRCAPHRQRSARSHGLGRRRIGDSPA